MRKTAEKLSEDLNAIADRVSAFSYYSDADRIRQMAKNIEETFVKPVCASCGQRLASND